jgi:heat-inducible transcriptional repressor
MGLIVQPHTSAGRIPSDKGYRLYVDRMMEEKDKAVTEMNKVLIQRVDRLELVLKQLAKLIANNTNYATMISGPQYRGSKLKFLQLSRVESQKLLVVLVVEGNLVKNAMIDIKEDISDENILKLNVLLNSALNGLSIDEINLNLITQLKEQAGEYSNIVASVLETVAAAIRYEAETPQIYTSGATNIFRYPELVDGENASRLISTLEEKEQLVKLLQKPDENGDENGNNIQVYIGEESPVQDMKDCSVITAQYDLGDGVKGTVGVIGPKRMDYEKVVGTLKSLSSQLDDIYKKKN